MNTASLVAVLDCVWNNFVCLFYRFFGRKYMCKCGHLAKWKTKLSIDDRVGVYCITESKEHCPECWAKATIRCAWCGETILPGDAITLYTPGKNFVIPDYAVIYTRKPRIQLVGCLRWNCAESGIDRAGFWVMPGKVDRVLSPAEMIIAGINNGDSSCVIVNDLHDPRQAIHIPDIEEKES